MDDGLKQRFVGAIVLIALAIIFVPMVFDKPNPQYTNMEERVPPKPQPEPFVITQVQEPEIKTQSVIINETEPVHDSEEKDTDGFAQQDLKETGDNPIIEGSDRESVADAQYPEANNNGLPQAWVVRLGTFSKPENAAALLKKLRQQGYKAFSRTSKSADGELIRIYVGPKLIKQTAESLKDKLKNEFQLDGQVVRFQV